LSSVLVVSSDRVGEQMAGPAIRAYEIARALAADREVTLAAPPGSTLPTDGEVALVEAAPGTRSFLELARRHDVLVAQFLPGSVLARLIGSPPRLVLDLYDPRPLEVLERAVDSGSAGIDFRVGAEAAEMLAYLAAADFVICASERQRDLWVGAMMGAGLIEPARYAQDPGYRQFVDVVPFGIPGQAPVRGEPVLKGVWPGIERGDRVVVWGGGVWDWLDPLTAVRAVERASDRIERLKLFFLGTGRPPLGEETSFPAMAVDSEFESYVRERSIEHRLVVVNRGWVPYTERGRYLLEADLGISTHLDHLEARYAFRTRVLDYLWAGLPTVATEGDVLSDLIEAESLGRTAPAGASDELAKAIVDLLANPGEHDAIGSRIGGLAPMLRWSRAVEPLRRFCERPPGSRRPEALARARALVRRSRGLRRRQVARESGLKGVIRDARRKLR
jgi:hypothetical protein